MKNCAGADAVLIHDQHCQLAEGLCWGAGPDGSAAELGLWYVDIHGRRVYFYSPDVVGVDLSWAMPERIGWLLPSAVSGEWLLGCQSGVARARFVAGAPVQLRWVDRLLLDRPALRLNDAKADAVGNVWFGVMNNDDTSRVDGALYRLDASGRSQLVDDGYKVPNGPAISPDGGLLLHTDSARRVIYAFDCVGSALHNKRVWRRFVGDKGYPDGMTFDAEGCVWVAHWGGGCVSRFSANGELLARHVLPVSRVTNVCFGGTGLSRLFVSTASVEMTPAEHADQPHAGGIFELCGVAVSGLPSQRAAV